MSDGTTKKLNIYSIALLKILSAWAINRSNLKYPRYVNPSEKLPSGEQHGRIVDDLNKKIAEKMDTIAKESVLWGMTLSAAINRLNYLRNILSLVSSHVDFTETIPDQVTKSTLLSSVSALVDYAFRLQSYIEGEGGFMAYLRSKYSGVSIDHLMRTADGILDEIADCISKTDRQDTIWNLLRSLSQLVNGIEIDSRDRDIIKSEIEV